MGLGDVDDVDLRSVADLVVNPLEVASLATERRSGVAAEEEGQGARSRSGEADALGALEAPERQVGDRIARGESIGTPVAIERRFHDGTFLGRFDLAEELQVAGVRRHVRSLPHRSFQ